MQGENGHKHGVLSLNYRTPTFQSPCTDQGPETEEEKHIRVLQQVKISPQELIGPLKTICSIPNYEKCVKISHRGSHLKTHDITSSLRIVAIPQKKKEFGALMVEGTNIF